MSEVLKNAETGALELRCEWFLKCLNGTLKAAPHPILGPVPCCDRCRRAAAIAEPDMMDIELKLD